MKRIQYHQYGGPEVMRLEDFEPTRPGSGEVLVRVRAAAANPMDWGIRSGAMKMVTGRKFPRALGYDFAGVVEAVGEGVTRLAVGDEVLGGASIKASGAFAEMVLAAERGVVKKPAELSFEEAAAIPTVGLTALQAVLKKGKLRPGQSVFINGCLGGVGRAGAQLALAHGASVGGSCRATATRDARDLGLDPIVAFDFDPTALSGRFDLVVDTADTLPTDAAKKMLKPDGRIVSIHPTPANIARSALPGPYNVLITRPVTEDLGEVARAAGRGTLRVPIARTVPLAEAIAALTELERDGTPKGGKLVITTE
ncbi:NADPH:quinone reductase [Streptomyces noursei ZPM]|uniref:NADPH:quinone reductase n=1 Tax=Streptomyces noursei TaxID=1971 RepID=A0A401QUM7_STRNR|nr:NADP-dependent oxidoreductase [Streptomyces noursei]AKA01929.1 NADPH:quinone reductase [Streptomyces noursei ZPM]EOT05072.1 NADPH:quinone reductase [Streptomyces noursei CCRC 11814]EXU92708.1 NADPH:quinone reductase [Streptomyces noursei PD-1]MCZ0972720.1 NADP-dependent oxidoreductase [Streptomyces noursei]UWS70392.1 NADP-dependent oxidoreductase [Streptomyces noursei]